MTYQEVCAPTRHRDVHVAGRRFVSVSGRAAFLAVVGVLLVGCPHRSTPIERAVDFLVANQVTSATNRGRAFDGFRDYEGNWPQHFYFADFPALRIREVSPFMVAFVHHALTPIVPGNLDALGLNAADHVAVSRMRKGAMGFMRRFESPEDALDAGTYGFWPQETNPRGEGTLLSDVLFEALGGPVLMGSRTPLNLGAYPQRLALPSDADVTGAVYAAILDDALLDGGPGSARAFEHFFADWRDTGAVPRRLNPDWLPDASGAFFTWLNYQPAGVTPVPNDVDLVVNATALYTLGRFDRLETDGVREAVALINFVVEQGIHRTAFDEITNYYPDNLAFEYFVSRAFSEGGVAGLQPAVETLADDLEQSVLVNARGRMFWDRGDPHLNTAFAILTLLNAGRDTPLIRAGIDYLIAEQDPVTGGWDESVFFIARVDSGLQVNFASASLTTAMALEALCRYTLDDPVER